MFVLFLICLGLIYFVLFCLVLNRGRSVFHFSGVFVVYLKVCFLNVNLNGEDKGSYAC